MNALNVGRIKLGAGNLDAQRRSISLSVDYANNRVQFKQPISNFGAIKEKLASMATSCYAGESACYRAASDIQSKIHEYESSGLTKQESELKGVEEFALECSILKVAISEDMQICADEGVQIFGGMGFSAEAPIESAWRDARIGRIYEGKVVKLMDFGAFVNFYGKRDGLVHVSQISEERVNHPKDVLTEGQNVKVKLMGIDDRGKSKLSMKVIDQSTGKEIEKDS